jgi:hypothetical protein
MLCEDPRLEPFRIDLRFLRFSFRLRSQQEVAERGKLHVRRFADGARDPPSPQVGSKRQGLPPSEPLPALILAPANLLVDRAADDQLFDCAV